MSRLVREMDVEGAPHRGEWGEDARPTEDELRLLLLLVTGATDERAARELGWSRRTLRRRLQGVMHKLGARSRFEAGYRLARSGWIDDHG